MAGDGGSKSQTVSSMTAIEPPEYAKPYLEELLEGAQSEYTGAAPTYYPDSTVVGWDPRTTEALSAVEAEARSGSGIYDAAQDEALKTIRGDYVAEGNPYLQNMIEQASAPVLSNLGGQFSKGGRLGSGAHADVASRNLADMAGRLAYSQYGDERTRQLQTAGQADTFRNMGYADAAKLGQVGAAHEELAKAKLAEQISRHNFGQNRERQKLQDYAALVRGGTFGSTQTAQTPHFYNPAANYLGLGLGAAGMGNMLFGKAGGGGLLQNTQLGRWFS